MIVYKTFTGQINNNQDVLAQQNAVRNQLAEFTNEVRAYSKIIQINELFIPEANQFTATVWYFQADEKAAVDWGAHPEGQSADVLAQSLRDRGRRDRLKTMVDEHMIRSDSS